jgi:arylsulfatase A-like enzyme
LVVRWPGRIKAGSSSDRVTVTPDLFSTVVEACGLPPVKSARDGVSFLPTLEGRSQPKRGPVFWHYPHYGNQGGFPGGAMRKGDWKLIERYEDGSAELYHLSDDLSERRNLAAEEPERVREMRAALDAWRKDVGAKMPTPNPARKMD